MKLDRRTTRDFAFAQCRAWACYVIWYFYMRDEAGLSILGFFEYVAFLIMTEIFYQKIKAMKGKK